LVTEILPRQPRSGQDLSAAFILSAAISIYDHVSIKYGRARSRNPARWYRVYDERLEAIEGILQEDVSSLSIRGKSLDPADTWRLSEQDRKKLSTSSTEDAMDEAEKKREQRKQKLKKYFALHYGKLPEEQFLAYLLKYGFDMDYEEMAEFTGKSKEALRKNIWQGKPNLPKSLKSQKKPGRKPKK
jgi:DNA-directed RNA polymerase specialized sigma24 family protein